MRRFLLDGLVVTGKGRTPPSTDGLLSDESTKTFKDWIEAFPGSPMFFDGISKLGLPSYTIPGAWSASIITYSEAVGEGGGRNPELKGSSGCCSTASVAELTVCLPSTVRGSWSPSNVRPPRTDFM